MKLHVNPPHLQDGPILFAVLCAFGSVVVVQGLLTLPVGSEPWMAGALGLLIIVTGFLFIDLGWLWIQREVTIADGNIVVRRWIEAIRGQQGRVIPLGQETRAAITLDNVRSLRIERRGIAEAAFTLGYWEPPRVRQLIEALRTNNVSLGQYWVGEYPPDVL